MSILGNILGTIIDTASLPVAIIKDAATLGGVLTDRQKTYTQEKAEDVKEDLEDLDDNLRKL
jgi:hypothetical protein